MVNGQKFDQTPNTGLLLEAFGHFLCLFFADAWDFRQLHGILFQHVQTLIAETGNNFLCHFRPDTLDGAGGQKRQNFACCLRHEAF